MSSQTAPLHRVTVSIPSELADFMQEVWVMIEWHDERIEKESDDSIQAPNIAPVIGGVVNVAAKYFSFRYIACKDPPTVWHLTLFDNEIEDIATRRVTTLTLWRCVQEACRDLFTNKAELYCRCNP